MLQHGAYNLLIDAIYDREKFPTREEAIDWVWASSADEVEAVGFVLDKFFKLDGDIYRQTRIADEIEIYIEFCKQQSEKGKKGGRPKANGLNDKPSGLNNKPEQSRNKAEKSLTTNQEPLTTNQLNTLPNGKGGNSKSSPVPYQKILDLYHTHCSNFPKAVKLSNKRKASVRTRWKDDADNLGFWESYFKHAATSRFLNGQNDRGWVADFDFLISERAMIGMQEGKYHG